MNMHTDFHEIRPFGRVAVDRNGDWSGVATVKWTQDGVEKVVELPAKLLARVGIKQAKTYVLDHIVDALDKISEEDE